MPHASPRKARLSRKRRDALAYEYTPFIRRIASGMVRRLPSQIRVDDLISAGYEGLLDALGRFDPRRADTLGRYAEYRVRGAMLDELRSLDPLGRDMRGRANRLRDTVHALSQRLGRAPDEQEIADAMGLPVEVYRRLLVEMARTAPASLDHVDATGEMPADDDADSPFDTAQRAEVRDRLAEAIEALPERQRLVVTLYYYEDLNLREIGDVLGVTESRVCQIHIEASERLRATLAPSVAEL
jgi:RNA polymerase sigma factor for flagellar operon FliA